jgi:hypothetical protein
MMAAMTRFDLDVAVAQLARRQHGVFTDEQALARGMTRNMIHVRLAAGLWIRLAPGVYALAGSVLTMERQYKAAQLSAPGASIGGLAAAALHEWPGFRTVRPEIVVAPGVSARHPLALAHRYEDPRLTVVRGIVVTTIAQTVFDVAHRIAPDRLDAAVDHALLTGRLRLDDLLERLAAYEGTRRRGLATVRPLVEEHNESGFVPPESALERRLLRLLRQLPDLGPMVVQARFPWRHDAKQRCDILVPGSRLLIEGDGRLWHARVRDFERDRERDNEANAHGYAVLRFTWRHISRERQYVLNTVTRTARIRAREAA